MKSEERHELQHNDLVDSFAGLYIFLRQNWIYLVLIVALAILGFEIYKIRQVKQLDTRRQAWAQLNIYQTPQDLQRHVISKFSIPSVQAQAYVKIGDFYLTLVNLGNPPKIMGVTATKSQALHGASMAFNKVVKDYPSVSLAFIRAKLGLAQVDEDRGQWSKAKAIYDSMLVPGASPAEKSLVELIRYRLKRLHQWARPVLVGYVTAKKPSAVIPGVSTAIGPNIPAQATQSSTTKP